MGYRAHPPSALLADIGKNRFGRFRRSAALERFDDEAWVPVARFGSVAAADEALDEMVARGSHPDHLRVTEDRLPVRAWVAVALGAAAVGVVIWLVITVLANQ